MKNGTNLKSFKDLIVWQKSVDLAVILYKITETFPHSELYGIVNQIRRSVVSISSNIAEGFKRVHKKEKLQFYNIAYSSAAELENQIEISYRLQFLADNNYKNLIGLITEISKMMDGLIKSLNSKSYILNPHLNLGFTIIELITALSILAIMGSIAFLGLYNFRLRRGLELDVQKIAAALREAHNRSVTQLDGNQWGVHFENPTGAPDFYQVFSGISYASGTPTGNRIILNQRIVFLDPSSSSSKDIIFSKVSGLLLNIADEAIRLSSGAASTTINIDEQGKVSY